MGNRRSTPSASCDLIRGRGQPIISISSLCVRRFLPAGGEKERGRGRKTRERGGKPNWAEAACSCLRSSNRVVTPLHTWWFTYKAPVGNASGIQLTPPTVPATVRAVYVDRIVYGVRPQSSLSTSRERGCHTTNSCFQLQVKSNSAVTRPLQPPWTPHYTLYRRLWQSIWERESLYFTTCDENSSETREEECAEKEGGK